MAVMGVTANINMQMLFVGKFYGRGGAASEGSGGDDGAEDYDGGGCSFFSLSILPNIFFSPCPIFFMSGSLLPFAAAESINTTKHKHTQKTPQPFSFLSYFNPYP